MTTPSATAPLQEQLTRIDAQIDAQRALQAKAEAIHDNGAAGRAKARISVLRNKLASLLQTQLFSENDL